jgi:hypothetical protein
VTLLLSVLLGRATAKNLMTIKPNVNEIDLIERLDRIQKYLVRYESKLFQLMDSMDETEDLEPKTRALENVVTRFEKVAYKFFEVGYKLDVFRAKERGTGVLDTAAAKEEIFRRLDRIEASGRTETDKQTAE